MADITADSREESRRRFLGFFSGVGLGGTLLPGVLWAQMQQEARRSGSAFTQAMLSDALALSGLTFSDEDQRCDAAGRQSESHALRRAAQGAYPERRRASVLLQRSHARHESEPGEATVAFQYAACEASRESGRRRVLADQCNLSHLIRTRQVTSTELTEMYLARLHRYNDKLNCVVTFLDDVARAQAKQADAEIKAGKHNGLLHGIPWGAKDIIAVKGYKTTWGSGAYKDQMIDEEASVVEMLRDAGAVLIAKLTSGELAQGDQWFGGQTKSPWNLAEGSSGSSAGPGSATAAGLVGFAIGSETSGSILSPSARCGVTGLRPTFGRVSRYGVMTLSWTQDRLGPLCRYAEDCAVVMSVIAKPDGRDLSVSDIPFNWNARLRYSQAARGLSQGRVRRNQRSGGEEAIRKLRWRRWRSSA